MNDQDALFAQLSTLSASVVLLLGIVLLWRRSLSSYIRAFRWQSVVLSAAFVLIGYFGHDHELYLVAVVLIVLKGMIIPWYLNRLYRSVGGEREAQPYVNIATSLVVAGLLVMLAYVITRPLVMVSRLPTRGGIPLAVGSLDSCFFRKHSSFDELTDLADLALSFRSQQPQELLLRFWRRTRRAR
jgi:hydrogenase-4 component E